MKAEISQRAIRPGLLHPALVVIFGALACEPSYSHMEHLESLEAAQRKKEQEEQERKEKARERNRQLAAEKKKQGRYGSSQPTTPVVTSRPAVSTASAPPTRNWASEFAACSYCAPFQQCFTTCVDDVATQLAGYPSEFQQETLSRCVDQFCAGHSPCSSSCDALYSTIWRCKSVGFAGAGCHGLETALMRSW